MMLVCCAMLLTLVDGAGSDNELRMKRIQDEK